MSTSDLLFVALYACLRTCTSFTSSDHGPSTLVGCERKLFFECVTSLNTSAYYCSTILFYLFYFLRRVEFVMA